MLMYCFKISNGLQSYKIDQLFCIKIFTLKTLYFVMSLQMTLIILLLISFNLIKNTLVTLLTLINLTNLPIS